MPKLYKKKKHIGLAPGTLVQPDVHEDVKITVYDYDKSDVSVLHPESVDECFALKDTKTVSWINLDGRNVDVIQKLDDHFGIHPLVLEDIVNTGQRPKLEEHDDYIFLVVRMILWDDKLNDVFSEQVSFVLGKNYLISFQERQGDVFDSVRQRIEGGKGRIRQQGHDYLMYALMDSIVDHYFLILEKIGERVEELEERLMGEEVLENLPAKIHYLKRQMMFLRKNVWPLREVISSIERNETGLITKSTKVFMRDVYDHTIQVIDTIESFQETLSGLHDIYLSSVSNKMNEIMKVLTIFAAIFIPLTFIAGIYGMNFSYMPELQWKYSYFVALGIMFSVGAGMVVYFRKKKWM